MRHKGDKIAALVWGALGDEDSDHMSGSFDVLAYYCIMDAFERGFNEFNFMGSRPFLNNGIFQFKRKWGTFIEAFYEPINDIYFKVCNLNPGTKSYVSNNPVIVRMRDKFAGRVLLLETANRKLIDRIVNDFDTEGLYLIDVYCLDGIDKYLYEYIRKNNLRIRLHDLEDSKYPALDFSMKYFKR